MSGAYIELIKNYMRDNKLRQELNQMARKTFGVEFEAWVQGGYFEGQYIPYSFFKDGKIIANVSANIMHFTLFGKPRTYVQIGTVMTREEERNHGYARKLIEYVIEDYKDKADDIYLFGNDFAKEFYLKRGFKEGVQYQYYLERWETPGERTFVKLGKPDIVQQKIYLEYLRKMKGNSAFAMDNYGLMTFWTAGMENAYYSNRLGCYILADITEETLYLNGIVSLKNISIMDVLRHMGEGFDKVVINFTPREEEMNLFEIRSYEEKDCNFLYLGEQLNCIKEKKLFFPVYSHA